MYKILFALVFISSLAFSQSEHVEVGIDEKLNSYIPLDVEFVNSEGNKIKLQDVIDKPVLLALVYYECPGLCSPLLTELGWVIDKVELESGIDYKVITISFNQNENYQIAAKWKKNYFSSMRRKIDPNAWLFLTGDSVNIHKLTNSVGFYFKPYGKDFVHASTLITLSPKGKITRYLFGPSFNQFDVKMALLEAKSGKSSPTISKILEFCYSYNPTGRSYTLNITKIVGVVMLTALVLFFVFVVNKKRRKE